MLVLGVREFEYVKLTIPPCTEAREFFVGVQQARSAKLRLGFWGPREIDVGRNMVREDQLPQLPPQIGTDLGTQQPVT